MQNAIILNQRNINDKQNYTCNNNNNIITTESQTINVITFLQHFALIIHKCNSYYLRQNILGMQKLS